jgi:hypothetical protein
MAMIGFVYRLRRNDFAGRVPASADAGTAAFVSTRFRADAPWTYDGNDGSQVYSITSVSTTVSVNRSSMWARTGAARSPSMLVHEQGHFDITALLRGRWTHNSQHLSGRHGAVRPTLIKPLLMPASRCFKSSTICNRKPAATAPTTPAPTTVCTPIKRRGIVRSRPAVRQSQGSWWPRSARKVLRSSRRR